jgi:hypothetical protein
LCFLSSLILVFVFKSPISRWNFISKFQAF